MTMHNGIIFAVVLGLTQNIVQNTLNKTCEYNFVESEDKHSLNLSLDAEIVYTIYEIQNGCIMNVDVIYENITKHVKVNRTEIYVSVAFICYMSEEPTDIHFSSDSVPRDFNFPKISVQIILGVCSIYMDDLTKFQKYGRIWSLVTTNSSQVYQGKTCSSLKDLRILSSSLMCTNHNKEHANFFFWEICENPFEQLFNLRLQGCSTKYYQMKQNLLQNKFPKLQTLWLKYINLTTTVLVFPWTIVYIDSSDADIIAYLSHYEESLQHHKTSIARSINIYDSDVNFDTNIRFSGHIKEIVINSIPIIRLNESMFKHTYGMIVLDISNNKIRELDRNAFFMQSKLLQINLSNNNLTSLPEGVFDVLHNLLYLDLSSNVITKLDQRLFKHLSMLEKVNLESNRITTLPTDFLQEQIKSLRYVFLSNNPLETVPLNALYAPKLSVIDIRQCKVHSSGLKSFLENINIYELQTAYSESLTYDPLGTVGKAPLIPRSIELSQNLIRNIPIDLTKPGIVLKFKFLLRAFQIDLSDNPLDCTCQMTLTALLAELYVKEGRFLDWKCEYPLELHGRYIAAVEPKENYCPVNIKFCPVKCACFERFEKQVFVNETSRVRIFIIDCRNINMSNMPEVMPLGQLELWFRNASLVKLGPRKYLKNTIALDASNNRINSITPGTATALWNVTTLKLDHNNLTHLPEQIARGNMSSLTLSGNPFICDCNTKWIKTWLLKRTSPVTDWNIIECTYNKSQVKQMISVRDSMFVCEKAPEVSISEHVILPSTIIGSILFVLISVSLLFYFQRFTIKVLLYMSCGFHPFDKEKDVRADMTYDAFIIYSYTDRVFIRSNLVHRLKNSGYRVADMYEDLVVGFSFLQNIEKFMNRTRRVIFCWTADMMENDFILSAWSIVYERAIRIHMESIILVIDGGLNKRNCNDEKLKQFLKNGRFIWKQSKYMYASVEYLMPRRRTDIKVEETIDGNEQENTIPMLPACPNIDLNHHSELVYVSYPDDMDFEIRQQLVPYLGRIGHSVKVLEHDFTPGADIREEIHDKLNNARNVIFIISKEVIADEVKMFLLSTVMSKSILCSNNYLLLFTSGPIHDVELTNELECYFNNFVTGRAKDPNFRTRVLQALSFENITICDENTVDLDIN